jgi:hypothetical protein
VSDEPLRARGPPCLLLWLVMGSRVGFVLHGSVIQSSISNLNYEQLFGACTAMAAVSQYRNGCRVLVPQWLPCPSTVMAAVSQYHNGCRVPVPQWLQCPSSAMAAVSQYSSGCGVCGRIACWVEEGGNRDGCSVLHFLFRIRCRVMGTACVYPKCLLVV